MTLTANRPERAPTASLVLADLADLITQVENLTSDALDAEWRCPGDGERLAGYLFGARAVLDAAYNDVGVSECGPDHYPEEG